MAEPSTSAESLELPSSTDDLPFDCSNPIPAALLDDSLLSDAMVKHVGGAPVAEWLADAGDERFGLAGDQLISMGDLMGGELMASSSGATAHMDDDLDADSKSVFTVHEMGTMQSGDVIGSSDFDLVDTIIQGGMQVDPTVIAKPFVEPADGQSNVSSIASDSCSASPLPTMPSVPRRRGRKPKSLLQQEAAAAAAAAAGAPSASSGKQPIRSLADKQASNGPSRGKSTGGGKQSRTPMGVGSSRPASDAQSSRTPSAGTLATGRTQSNCTPSVVTPSVVTLSGNTSSVVNPSVVTPSVTTPSVVTPSVVTPSVVTPSVVTPSVVTPSGGTSSFVTPSVVTPSGHTPASGTPGAASTSSAGGQPRRSVRICEQDPRDFLQELRQGHYLKPRMPSSPSKAAALGRRASEPRVDDSTTTADSCPAAADNEAKAPPLPVAPSASSKPAGLPPAEPTSTATPGKKRKDGGAASERHVQAREQSVKKKMAEASDSSDDSDSSSSSDDPDSVPLMQIKQKLAGSGAQQQQQQLSRAAEADPDSVPLVQIKRSLQEAESGASGAGKQSSAAQQPVKRKVGRPPKNPQAAGGAEQPSDTKKAKRPPDADTAKQANAAAPSIVAGAPAGGGGSSAVPISHGPAGSSRDGPQAAESSKKQTIKKQPEGGSSDRQQLQAPQHRAAPSAAEPREKASAPVGAKGTPLAAADSSSEAARAFGAASSAAAAGDSAASCAASKPVAKTSLLSKRSNPVVALGAQVVGASSGKSQLAEKAKAVKTIAGGGKDSGKPAGGAAAEAPGSMRPSSSAPAAGTSPLNPAGLKRKAAADAGTIGDGSPTAKAVKVAAAVGPGADGRSEPAGATKQPPKSALTEGGAPAPGNRVLASVPAGGKERSQQERPREVKGVHHSSSGRDGGDTVETGTAGSKGKPRSDGGADDDELIGGGFTFIDSVEDEGSDWDEENDPDRLWCICKRPHDNRFMICCDRCQEWYHGDCVGITKARGKQIELNREEYICKTCKEGESASKPRTGSDSARDDRMKDREPKERMETSMSKGAKKDGGGGRSPAAGAGSQIGEIRKKPSATIKDGQAGSRTKRRVFKKFKSKPPQCQCIAAGCDRLAAAGAVYCGPGCTRRYAGDMLRVLESRHAELQRLKASLAKRAKAVVLPASAVVVVERYSGKVISGSQAPTRATLSEFLLKHPSFEVLQPGRQHKPSSGSASPVSPARFYQKDKRPSEGAAVVGSGGKPERKSSSSSAVSMASRQNSSSSTLSSVAASAAATTSAAEVPAPDPETIRRNVRKTLREMLWNRVKEADDISVSEGYVESIALAIETELFNLQHDTGAKYKSKYRSLLFNIKDPKNKGLFRKIVKSRIRPDKLVHMSSDELASKELMQWRESEMKHELDKIKEVEELRSHEEEPRVLHVSHKQEVELVNDDMSDLRQVILEEKPKDMDLDVTAKNVELDSAASDKASDPAASSASAAAPSDTTALHSSHLFDRNCKICTGQQAPPAASAAAPVAGQASKRTPKVERHVHLAKDEKRHVKVQLSAQPREIVDRVVARELRHLGRELEDMKRADAASSAAVSRSPPMEPTSTVESPRPPGEQPTTGSAGERTKPQPARTAQAPAPLWKGSLNSPEVTKFFATAHALAGPVENIKADLPDALSIVGRITPDQIWSYLNQLKLSTSKDVIVLSLTPLTDDEQAGYTAYYKYLSSKSRCGVVGNAAKTVKDMYIIPLSTAEGVPPQLMQYCGSGAHPGLAGLRSHSLISVVVRSKSKKSEPAGRAKKVQEHRKMVTFASSTPPADTDADAYEPYDPETPAVDYAWKPSSVVSAGLASSAADPIVRAYSQPDPRKLTALDVPGASPYSPTQSDYANDEAYDPADDLQPVLPASVPTPQSAAPAHGASASSSSELAEYRRSIEALNKRIEAEQEELRSKVRLLSGAATPATTVAASSAPSPSAAALLLSPPAASSAGGGLPLPKALQDIMNSSTFAAAAAAAAAVAAGDSKPPPAATVDVLGYLKQTLEQVKPPSRAVPTPGLPLAVVDPRVVTAAARLPAAAPADPRLPPRGAAAPAVSYPTMAVYNYVTVPSAAAGLASSLAQAAGGGGVPLPPLPSQPGYFPAAQPAAVYTAADAPVVAATQVLAQSYFTTPPTAAAAAAASYQQVAETAIPGLGDGIDWSAGATGRGGHSPYLLDERDYDERQPAAAAAPVAAAFGSGPSDVGRSPAAALQPPAVQRTAEAEQHAATDAVEDFQDHDYRTRLPQAGGGPCSGGNDDFGDHDERQRGAVAGSRAGGSPSRRSREGRSPEHRQQQQHWRGSGSRPSRDGRGSTR